MPQWERLTSGAANAMQMMTWLTFASLGSASSESLSSNSHTTPARREVGLVVVETVAVVVRVVVRVVVVVVVVHNC